MSIFITQDTAPEVAALMISQWRSMSTVEKGQLVETMCIELQDFTSLGVLHREPNISPDRLQWLIVARRYGEAFAEMMVVRNLTRYCENRSA